MTRWKAAGVHLAISLSIISLVAVALLMTWYPPVFVRMGRLGHLIALIGGVDLVVGPLLTLIVFRSGKPKLKLDLTVIALLQALALAYGLQVLWQSRPVFLVAVPDRFELVYANEIAPTDLSEGSLPEFRQLSLTGPRLVAAQLPLLDEELSILTFSAAEGRDIQVLPRYFVPFENASVALARHGQPLLPAPGAEPGFSEALVKAAEKSGRDPSSLVWVPISSRRGPAAAMLLDAETGGIVAPVDIDPWDDTR